MIRLDLTNEPRWQEPVPGLRLRLAPVTTAVMAAARADGACADLDPEAAPEVLALAMAKAVARQVVVAWEGVGDQDGNQLPVIPEGIDALLDIWPVFEAFQREVLGPQLVLDAEKNASAPSPNGTTAGATPIAPPAKASATTAQGG